MCLHVRNSGMHAEGSLELLRPLDRIGIYCILECIAFYKCQIDPSEFQHSRNHRNSLLEVLPSLLSCLDAQSRLLELLSHLCLCACRTAAVDGKMAGSASARLSFSPYIWSFTVDILYDRFCSSMTITTTSSLFIVITN